MAISLNNPPGPYVPPSAPVSKPAKKKRAPGATSGASLKLPNPFGLPQPGLGPVRKPAGAQATGPSLSSLTAPPAAAVPDYEGRFQAALDQTQQGLASQYGSALADINARESLANQAVALLPGQVSGIYDAGAASLAQQTGALDAAQKASGLTSFMGADAQMAPLQAAMAQDQAARLADVPLLQLGTAAGFQGQRGALNQAKTESSMSLMADAANAAAERQFQKEQAAQNNQWAIDAEQRSSAFDEQRSLRDYALEREAAAEQVAAARKEEGRAILNQFAPTDASAERGHALATAISQRPGKALDKQNHGAYKNALKLMRSGRKSKVAGGLKTINWSTPENVAKALEAAGFNSAAALFRYKYNKGGAKPAAPQE